MAFIADNFESMSYKELAAHLDRSYQAVAGKARRMGLKGGRRRGALNGNWKGGRSVLKSGYIRVGDRNEHSLVMEEALGRALVSPELVHHVDGDKANNCLENLCLCADQSEHRRIHWSLERAALELVKAGVIEFDPEAKRYYVADG
jgi:hypothetical protein